MSKDGDELDPALVFPGPIALVAGPGSGKTSRLALRIKHLVENQGVDPATITVITFTREAALNMKKRLTPPAESGRPDVTLPPEKHPALICTMHSLGWRIVAKNADRLGLSEGCKVQSSRYMRELLFEDAARICGYDSNFGKLCADIKSKVGEPPDEKHRNVFDTYRRILLSCNAIDFDDHIILACQLIREHEDIREEWRQRAKYLLVDEYQDINKPQLDFIQLLSGEDAFGLFVVGDDDQSIYGFRGAEPRFIRDFRKYFNKGQTLAISDCFRCQPHVIRAAHGFIDVFNPDRLEKPEPKCNRPEGQKVVVHSVASDVAEAEIIASMAANALIKGEVLVLLPEMRYAEPLKAELTKRLIAFDALASGGSEVNLLFAALRDWIRDQKNNLAFRELVRAVCDGGFLEIPRPKVLIAKKVAEREAALTMISNLWKETFNGKSLREALTAAAPTGGLYAKLEVVANKLALATTGTPTEFAQRTFEALRPWPNSKRTLDELAATHRDANTHGNANSVRIMTMRNSKRLEAESVFVIGLEDGAFPSAVKDSLEFQEEARLFYVSLTRAKQELHLFHTRKRSGGMTYKAASYDLKPSPFLTGIPKANHESRYHPSAAQRTAKKK